jgi:Xaa-Pro aminopeptidase
MPDLDTARKALREEGLSAWLFCNVFHRDEIADAVLGVPRSASNSRPWVCVLFAEDRPARKIVHRIEAGILDHVRGESVSYHTREEFLRALRTALPAGGRTAADYSPNIPVGSFLDHGTALLVRSLGVDLVPAEALVARCLGSLDAEGIRSHHAAAAVLYAAVASSWERLSREVRAGRAVTEGDVREWISSTLSASGLESDGPPIVGAGRNTSDPHFSAAGRGARVEQGDVVQFDVWAKEGTPGAVYADISWVGVCAASPTAQQVGVFQAVRDAREAAVSLLQTRLGADTPVTGADLDRAARAVLIERGFQDGIRHRTGHSIGTRVHGFGVNLDSVEFPDDRQIPHGACVSIEPGIYLEEFGMRTEIDCIRAGQRLVVPGPGPQSTLLTTG